MKKCSFLDRPSVTLLGLSAIMLTASPHALADAESEIAAARADWVAQNLDGALAHLELALADEPGNDEANCLIALVKVMALLESNEFSALVASAGVENFNDDIFNMSGEIDGYPETEVIYFSDAAWVRDTSTSSNNDDSARSGLIFDWQSSAMQATFTGPGLLEFDFRISSEEFFDYLELFIDGDYWDGVSGIEDWQTYSVYLPEPRDYEVSWVYRKDSIFSEGEDAAWVDNVQFTPDAAVSSVEFVADSELSDALDLDQEVRSGVGEFVSETEGDFPIFAEEFSTEEIATWLDSVVRPILQESISHLTNVSDPDFQTQLSAAETRDEALTLDYADTRGLQAVFEAFSAIITLIHQHNLDLLLRAVGDREYVELPTPDDLFNPDDTSVHAQWLFSHFPELFALKPDADLESTKAAILDFWEAYKIAADLVLSRTSDERRLFNTVEAVPIPNSQWFAQTVFSRDGQDAAQSGESSCFESVSILTLDLSGPGTLSFWSYLTDVDGFGFPGHGVDIYGIESDGFRTYVDSVFADEFPEWALNSVFIESGTTAVELHYFNCSGNPMNAAFIDEMNFTPEGDEILDVLSIAEDDLDGALDGNFGATSEPALEDTDLQLSDRDDLDFRTEFQRFLDSLDGTIQSDGDTLTLAPYFDGAVDPAKLRPIFYNNFAIQGSFPDPTLGGVFPEFNESQIEERFLQSTPEYDPFFDRLMTQKDFREFFGPYFESLETREEPGEPLETPSSQFSRVVYIYWDTYYDFDTAFDLERSSTPNGPWRFLDDGLNPSPFERTEIQIFNTYYELQFEDLLFDGKGFYRLTFDFGNAPLTD